eukprot:symbB.v1.2.004783.t1/scaffold274.1/size244435/24
MGVFRWLNETDLPQGACGWHPPKQMAPFVLAGSVSRARDTRHLASFLKTSFDSEDDLMDKATEKEMPRPPDSPLNNLAKFRMKHERTQDGFLCSAAGCTSLPTPDGTNIGRKWCYIEPSQVEEAGKTWGWCRAFSGWPDIVEGVELPA